MYFELFWNERSSINTELKMKSCMNISYYNTINDLFRKMM